MNMQSLAPWWTVSIFLLVLNGCTGNDKPSPVDVEAAAFEELRSELRSVIKDPARTEQALAIADDLQQAFSVLRGHLLDRRGKVGRTNADYDASRDDVIALLKKVQDEIASNQKRISLLHRQLVEVTTSREWSKLAKTKRAAMNATIDSIRAI
jgi:hypothetical protein